DELWEDDGMNDDEKSISLKSFNKDNKYQPSISKYLEKYVKETALEYEKDIKPCTNEEFLNKFNISHIPLYEQNLCRE
ncbi:hypothetical protein M569_17556, partial [Genlisea aurea]